MVPLAIAAGVSCTQILIPARDDRRVPDPTPRQWHYVEGTVRVYEGARQGSSLESECGPMTKNWDRGVLTKSWDRTPWTFTVPAESSHPGWLLDPFLPLWSWPLTRERAL